MHLKKLILASCGLAVTFLLPAGRASAKELHWKAFEVRARIDSDGRVHVRERQNIVFDGDWNGGYRVFRLHPPQRLQFDRLTRVDSGTGAETPLAQGDLSKVDQYKWMDSTNLRWRSRLPSDPEFSNQEIDYVLEYRLSNVLKTDGTGYVLDHDFAFPDREGVVEHFSADLEIDPAWRPEGAFPGHWEATNLAPGNGFVVKVSLTRLAAGVPAGVVHRLSNQNRMLLSILFYGALLALLIDFVRKEGPSGRLSSASGAAPDKAWLARNVFSWKPEEVGAAWHDSVGAPEVTAVISRLAGEKKISLNVEKGGLLSRDVLHMKLLAERDSFAGYEKSLIDALFFGNRTETDTASIKSHYESTGFDPASKIATALLARVAQRPGMGGGVKVSGNLLTNAIRFGGLALMILTAIARPGTGVLIVTAVFSALAFGVPALVLGRVSRKKIDGFPVPLVFAVVISALAGRVPFWFLGYGLTLPFVAGWLAMILSFAMDAFNLAKSRETKERIGHRRDFAAARRYFESELSQKSPALEDAWVPYLLALGLNHHLTSWFSRFGGAAGASAFGVSSATTSFGSSSSESSSGFTGGGGAFGGAGASAAWVGAIGSMASGVSAPGSSGSGGGGGGGGGGGSSGGGGGGGW